MSIQNLFTPSTKKEFAKIYCKEINADDLFIENLETNNLKVDVIEERTLANNIRMANKIQLDCMIEDTPANGIICESVFKTNDLVARTGTEIVCSDLKVRRLLPKVGNSIEIAEIDVNVLDIHNGTKIRIQQPVAFNFIDEYGEYTMDFTAVKNGAYTGNGSIGTINSGQADYLFGITAFDLRCQYDGIYTINIVCNNSAILPTIDGYEIRLRKISSGEILAVSESVVGHNTAINAYNVHTLFCGKLLTSDVIRAEMSLTTGVDVVGKNFTARLYVSRFK